MRNASKKRRKKTSRRGFLRLSKTMKPKRNAKKKKSVNCKKSIRGKLSRMQSGPKRHRRQLLYKCESRDQNLAPTNT
jgi:hypothetical protein